MNDFLERVRSFSKDGTLIAWTPEEVGRRMIEAAAVVARTPVRVGPKAFGTAWPQIVVTAMDLVDEETQQRLMRFPHLVGSWESRIDDKTRKHMSREKQGEWERLSKQLDAVAYSRAEEAMIWPARYLSDRPLLADALTLWAFCVATGASLRESCKRRRALVYGEGRRARRVSKDAQTEPKNLHHQHIPGRRRDAAAIVCARLNAEKVAVRPASEEFSHADAE